MSSRGVSAVILAALFLSGFTLVLAGSLPSWPAAGPVATGVGTTLWRERTLEVMLQGFIILAGVISILLLLGAGRAREGPP